MSLLARVRDRTIEAAFFGAMVALTSTVIAVRWVKGIVRDNDVQRSKDVGDR